MILARNPEVIYLAIVLAPLAGALIAGLFGRVIGRSGAHWVTIIGVGISTVLSLLAYKHLMFDGGKVYNADVYTWLALGQLSFTVGFLVDQLSVTLMVVVSFVSWMIHIYTIGYMRDDPGYQRFFSYISLFTFAMLMLVMSNNFVQLFFGWEAVGLVSYLLIGFWFKREAATAASLKAFIVNRVGDFGFLIGIAAVLLYFNSLDYMQVFDQAQGLAGSTISLVPGPVYRRHGKIRPGSPACLVARFHGRPDTHFCVNSRGDDGNGRHFHGGAYVALVRVIRGCAQPDIASRRNDGVFHGAVGTGPE